MGGSARHGRGVRPRVLRWRLYDQDSWSQPLTCSGRPKRVAWKWSGRDPVHHQVDVGMAGVAVCHNERLVLGQLQVGEESVGHADHGLPIDLFLGVEGERDVVDGPLDAIRLRGWGSRT